MKRLMLTIAVAGLMAVVLMALILAAVNIAGW